MSAPPLSDKSVKELQALAAQTNALNRRPKKSKRLSRAAQLSLIDILSRWSGMGLAILAGSTIYLAAVAGRTEPIKAACWTGLVFAALYIARRLKREFRSGGAAAGRPYRWRANYTSALCFLSAAFGAGTFLVAPANEISIFVVCVLLGAVVASGVFHCAHPFSAAAVTVPALAFIVGASSSLGISLALAAILATASTGLLAIYIGAQAATNRAKMQFPRTTFLRREIAENDSGFEETKILAESGAA